MVPEGVDRGSLSGREGAECSLRPRVQLFHERLVTLPLWTCSVWKVVTFQPLSPHEGLSTHDENSGHALPPTPCPQERPTGTIRTKQLYPGGSGPRHLQSWWAGERRRETACREAGETRRRREQASCTQCPLYLRPSHSLSSGSRSPK